MDVICSVEAEDATSFAAVVDACRRAGLRVTAVLDAIGVIEGTVDEARLGELSAVPGVAAVERSRPVRTSDPGDEAP